MKRLNSCDGIYDNSLDVRFTRICDNACPFCIERKGISGMKTDVKKLISSTIQSGKQEILILGGEPFLLIEELCEYVKGIRPFVDKIYITTSLPITIVNNYDVFEEIMKHIDGLNISLQHYDDSLNNLAMHSTKPHQRIDGLLKHICKNEDYARKVRVSINLVRGLIDSPKSLDSFLKKMMKIGVQHVKINELQHEEKLYISFEDIFQSELHLSEINLKSPYSHGCQQMICLNGYKSLKLTLKRACFCVNNNLDATLSDMYKAFQKSFISSKQIQIVLYEDGTLERGWKNAK